MYIYIFNYVKKFVHPLKYCGFSPWNVHKLIFLSWNIPPKNGFLDPLSGRKNEYFRGEEIIFQGWGNILTWLHISGGKNEYFRGGKIKFLGWKKIKILHGRIFQEGRLIDWRVSCVCVTWLVQTCDVTSLDVWCVTWGIHTCDVTRSDVWCGLFRCVMWFFHMCDMSCVQESPVWCESWMCMCDMTHSDVRRGFFRCVMCDVRYSYVWHDLFARVACLIEGFDVYVWHDSFRCVMSLFQMCDVWREVFICVTWLVRKSRLFDRTFPYVCVKCVWHMAYQFIWAHEFMCVTFVMTNSYGHTNWCVWHLSWRIHMGTQIIVCDICHDEFIWAHELMCVTFVMTNSYGHTN